ncbi:MAG: DUF58 domain-containing protein [Candidatus Limnocylindrales bacterium]
MSGQAWLGVGLAAVGALAGVPPLLLIGVLLVLVALLRGLWSRVGLRGVVYERRLGTERAVWGDQFPLDVVIWNRKLLPLLWLRAEDFVPDEMTLRERTLVRADRPGLAVFDNTWSLAWYERVVRHLHVVADRRGVYRLNAVRLRVADLFARETAEEERSLPATYVVRPRSLPVHEHLAERAAVGERVAPASLFRDPALFAGVRPYQPGDPLRQVHWKATAHTGRPVVKRFDPSRQRELLLALDIQTVEGLHWLLAYEEELLEGLCVAAASLARRTLGEGAGCGLIAAAYAGTPQPIVWIAPSAGPGQLGRITDALARLSPGASAPYERVLASLPRRMGPGSTIVALSARDPVSFLAVLRRLTRTGYGVQLVALGPEADARAAAARRSGVAALTAQLRPDWRTSDALVIGA